MDELAVLARDDVSRPGTGCVSPRFDSPSQISSVPKTPLSPKHPSQVNIPATLQIILF